jgi:hypothetical protein
VIDSKEHDAVIKGFIAARDALETEFRKASELAKN